jgi:hypothetical protein
MSSDDCPLNPADFEVLCQVVTRVARGSGLPPQDAEDFGQHVHVHLIERRYAPVVGCSSTGGTPSSASGVRRPRRSASGRPPSPSTG